MIDITEDDLVFVRKYATRFAIYRSSVAYPDVVSDGNLGLIEAQRTHDPSLGSWPAWRFVSVRRAIVQGIRDRLGRNGERIEDPVDFEASGPTMAEAGYSSVEAADELRRLWCRLTPREREVFASYAELGPNGASLAASWGLTDTRVRQVRRAAQRRLGVGQ